MLLKKWENRKVHLSNEGNNIQSSFSYFAEWTLYEQVAFAAMDCQQHDVAKVGPLSLSVVVNLSNCILLSTFLMFLLLI